MSLLREAYVFNTNEIEWATTYHDSFLRREGPNIKQTLSYYSKQFETLGIQFEPEHYIMDEACTWI